MCNPSFYRRRFHGRGSVAEPPPAPEALPEPTQLGRHRLRLQTKKGGSGSRHKNLSFRAVKKLNCNIMIWIIVYFIYSTEFIPVLNARTRLLLQDTAGAALKSRLRLSALTDKKNRLRHLLRTRPKNGGFGSATLGRGKYLLGTENCLTFRPFCVIIVYNVVIYCDVVVYFFFTSVVFDFTHSSYKQNTWSNLKSLPKRKRTGYVKLVSFFAGCRRINKCFLFLPPENSDFGVYTFFLLQETLPSLF